jgi:ribose 5-phosphate isomerase A
MAVAAAKLLLASVETFVAMLIAERALEYIRDGQIVGLGTGHAASAFIHALAERVHDGLRVRGIPTSRASAELAKELGIPLTSLDEVDAIDVAVDGADEVDPRLDLIKGLGGALLREKVVATAARFFVVVVGSEKIVPALGSHGVLPVEVVPFALAPCRRRLAALGCRPEVRLADGKTYLTDNGNPILDCHISPLDDPAALERAVLSTPGVVETGLFLDMADVVLVQENDVARVLERRPKP